MAVKMLLHEAAEPVGRIYARTGAEESEPFRANSHMGLLIVIDHVEDRGANLVF